MYPRISPVVWEVNVTVDLVPSMVNFVPFGSLETVDCIVPLFSYFVLTAQVISHWIGLYFA